MKLHPYFFEISIIIGIMISIICFLLTWSIDVAVIGGLSFLFIVCWCVFLLFISEEPSQFEPEVNK